MRVERIQLRDFRNYEAAEVRLADGLTVVTGANGAGKTNLLEAVYFGCTARSPRTSNERELVRRGGDGVARVVLDLAGDDGEHRIEVGFQPGEAKHLRVDDSPVDCLSAVEVRPLVSVFLPERLELVKGAPAARRAHLDQLVAALWPSRAETRSAYSRALAQRNALVARIRAGAAGPAALGRLGCGARAARGAADGRPGGGGGGAAAAVRRPGGTARASRGGGAALPAALGCLGRGRAGRRAARSGARPTSSAGSPRTGRTATSSSCCWAGSALRAYGSQGQQRAALLALLFAERALLAERRARPPLMLLDDVMSELDAERRELLADLLRAGGQSVITTTEPEHVPGAALAGGGLISVENGALKGRTRAVAA